MKALITIKCHYFHTSWICKLRGGLDYVQSSSTINVIITTRNPRANQYVVTKNFLFAKTTHTILSRIYYTQDSIRNIIFGDYHSTCQS